MACLPAVTLLHGEVTIEVTSGCTVLSQQHITSLAGLFKHEPFQLPLGSIQPDLAATRAL